MKKVIIILVFIMIVIFSIIVNSTTNRPLPFQMDNIERIEIKDYNGRSLKIFQDSSDIGLLKHILEDTDGNQFKPACPFGLQMVIYEGNEIYLLEVGTDDVAS